MQTQHPTILDRSATFAELDADVARFRAAYIAKVGMAAALPVILRHEPSFVPPFARRFTPAVDSSPRANGTGMRAKEGIA